MGTSKIVLFIAALLYLCNVSAQDTLRVPQFAGIGALTKYAIADEALTAGDAVFIRPDTKRIKKADRANAPSKSDAQAICLQTADEDSLTWIITNGRVFEWPEALVIGETYYLTDTVGHISIYPPTSGVIQKIGVAVDTFTLDVNIQKPVAPSYKIYAATLTQEGTSAPVATVLQNTLGGELIWSYSGTGSYDATLTGVFAENKTIIVSDKFRLQGDDLTGPQYFHTARISADAIRLRTGTLETPSDEIILTVPYFIEIRVYP